MVKTKCEVYSRVVGYIRPIEQWNDGKQQEFLDRVMFDLAVKEVKRERKFDRIISDIQAQTNINKSVGGVR